MHFGSFVGIAAAPSLPELRLRSDTSKGNAFTPWQGRNNSITSLSEVQPKGRASERSGESESRLGKIIHLLVPDRPFSRRSYVAAIEAPNWREIRDYANNPSYRRSRSKHRPLEPRLECLGREYLFSGVQTPCINPERVRSKTDHVSYPARPLIKLRK